MNEELIKIWRAKLAISKGIRIKKGIAEGKNYVLNQSLNDFEVNKVFIKSFLSGLWNFPEAIFQILENSDLETVQKNLAPFICHNFFCNHLSGNYFENNLLYIISMMLKSEIDKLESISQVDSFLENTKCGYLLEELQRIPDVQIYFKKVIMRTVEKIERTYSFRQINFNASELLKEFNNLKDEEEKKTEEDIIKNLDEYYKKIINRKLIDLSINYSKEDNDKKSLNRHKTFVAKYSPDITLKDIKSRQENAKKDNKNNLYEYFNKLENGIKSNNRENLFANTTLMNNLLGTKAPAYLLSFYQTNFFEVISFIELLLEDLMNNLSLLPNSIKYICKIISILIRNKFNDISKIEENEFISKFIIGKILIPIISFPSFNALICDFIISGNTIKNLEAVSFILKKLFSGKLYHNDEIEGDYTPFNWFFMDNMEKILHFFEKSTSIHLPNFIEQYINEQLPKDYLYSYFKENKEQICCNISICFNINNLFSLIKFLKKGDSIFQSNNPKIRQLKMALTRLKSEQTMNEIRDVDEKKANINKSILKENEKYKNQEIDVENYYLFNDLEIEKKYENLFSINNKIANFYIDIKKLEEEKKLDEKEKNIIKVKNYLCNSLGNFRILNKTDFNIDSTSNTLEILNEIKTYMTLPSFTINNNTIPSIWYINSILELLTKIPEDYKNNDFKKLYQELTNNVNESINALNFEKLILFRNKLKFIDKINNYYDNVKYLFNTIVVHDNIKRIVEEAIIPVEINFKYDNEFKIFELMKSNINTKLLEDKSVYEIQKKNSIVFKTIEAFTRYFPNLSKYQLIQGINPFDIIKELSINKKFDDYFEIIKELVTKKIEIKQYESLYQENVKNYILNKIYEKIYPPEQDKKDIKIFKKSTCLSWVDPQLIIDKDYISDIMLPDILNEIEQINLVHTPYKKLNCIKEVFNQINNLIKFNEGEDKEIGADDIGPVLKYVLIKAHPFRIHTDIEFIKLFSKDEGKFESCLINIESMYDSIINCTAEDFNLSQEEFDKKCSEVR